MLEHSGACIAYGHPEFLDELREAATATGLGGAAVLPVGTQFVGEPAAWDAGRALPDQDTTYAVIYTSGATGRPPSWTARRRPGSYFAR